jgi:hypothetical protein
MTTKSKTRVQQFLNKSMGSASVRGMKLNESVDLTGNPNEISLLSGHPGQDLNKTTVKYLANVPDAAELRVKRAQRAREKYDQLVKALSFNDCERPPHERKYKYPQDFYPLVFFFKYLAKKPTDGASSTWGRLKLWVPDTLVANDGENPTMWFYTSPEGYVYRTDNFTTTVICDKLGAAAPRYELVAISKKPLYREDLAGNDVRLISSSELNPFVSTFITSRAGCYHRHSFLDDI